MHEVSKQLDEAGLERRDVLVRETKTLRGGDRPRGCARPSRVQERLVDAEGVLGAVASLQKTVRWAS